MFGIHRRRPRPSVMESIRRPHPKTLGRTTKMVAAISVITVTGGTVGIVTGPNTVVTTTTTTTIPAVLAVCSNPGGVLNSPFTYNATGTSSWTTVNATTTSPAGLPTFGIVGSNFPNATSGVIVNSGTPGNISNGSINTAATVYFFTSGSWNSQGNAIFPGNNSAYVGGYHGTTEASINGNGTGGTGNPLFSGAGTPVTIEYLTLYDINSNTNSADINFSQAPGYTVSYNTIGPNIYPYGGGNGEGAGGGYGLLIGSNSTVSYNCFTQNQAGGINAVGGPTAYNSSANILTGDTVTYNDFESNGIGNYPDDGYAVHGGCGGCAADAMKAFWTENFVFTHNKVNGGYDAGVWFDFNNAGANISSNSITNNWSIGLQVEGDYNMNITNNSLSGNGWGAGTWPSGSCGPGGTYTCTNGYGPITGSQGGNPYSAIYVSDSAANSLLASNYSGQLNIVDNNVTNNFGGIMDWTDTGRVSGVNQCNSPLQDGNTTYFQNWNQWVASDVTISGTTTLTSTAGFHTLWAPTSAGSGYCNTPGTIQEPVTGTYSCPGTCGTQLYAYGNDLPTTDGGLLGDPVSCTSTTVCTVTTAGTNASGQTIYISELGGCGVSDLWDTTGPGTSGTPSAAYWMNCLYGTHGTTVSGNTIAMNTATVANCSSTNECGVEAAVANEAGWPITGLNTIYNPYFQTNVAISTSPLANVFSNNTYTWSGSGGAGSGVWQFDAGALGTGGYVSHTTWCGVVTSGTCQGSGTYSQDAASTGF